MTPAYVPKGQTTLVRDEADRLSQQCKAEEGGIAVKTRQRQACNTPKQKGDQASSNIFMLGAKMSLKGFSVLFRCSVLFLLVMCYAA